MWRLLWKLCRLSSDVLILLLMCQPFLYFCVIVIIERKGKIHSNCHMQAFYVLIVVIELRAAGEGMYKNSNWRLRLGTWEWQLSWVYTP